MEDGELPQTSVTASINPRFILASCLAQLLAPPAGLTLFDLTYSNNEGFSPFSIAIGLAKAVPYTWQLALEPLLLAVFLAALISTMAKRRNAIAMIVLVTVLNVIVSGIMIVGRAL